MVCMCLPPLAGAASTSYSQKRKRKKKWAHDTCVSLGHSWSRDATNLGERVKEVADC